MITDPPYGVDYEPGHEDVTEPSWAALLQSRRALPLAVLLGGVLLHSMNVLITATLLPSIVAAGID
jgi:hypothetical protein